MNHELAEHISLMAAPIYAALLMRAEPREVITEREWLEAARKLAIRLARALWLQTLDTEA
jgi:hypothetical protein